MNDSAPKPRYRLGELLAQCDGSAAISPEDRAWLNAPPVGRELDDEAAQDLADARAADEVMQAIREGREKTIPLEEAMRRLGMDVQG
ncbi:hypothetical protein KDW98_32425 [Burkholderia vietnamiensis]|uniref:hypothetical protein n=1 Tax=Burkholderia vietnamiensis TaxID=60552 RepID=UPI001B971C15|nr:hypothetical protein [Burkholderia vietnamiensis]MBR8165840.1 hypothetical protein [Burkholderia vietnamiensis]